MKNPLTLLSEITGSTSPNIEEAATLEFCYDHVKEDNTIQVDLQKFIQHNLLNLLITKGEQEHLSYKHKINNYDSQL